MLVCPKCGLEVQGVTTVTKTCWKCGVRMTVRKNKRGRSDSQKRSQDQEKRAAKRYSMRKQPGSGSRDGAKGDLRDVGKRRAELKETIKKSFSLKLDVLEKIEREATGSEDPLLEIEFQGVFPHKRYVVLPDHAYESMINRLEALDADQADS
jgi:hypothetical protein